MKSEQVVIQSPTSYIGATARIWRLTRSENAALRWALLIPLAVLVLLLAWVFVTAWYVLFGILLVPYRIVRRGGRKRKRETLRHREVIEAVQTRV